MCHVAGRCAQVLEGLKKVRKGSFPVQRSGYFWQGFSYYLYSMFVSIAVFTVTCKRIAAKLGYDELSWREN
jgi:hypothetical protein